MTVGALRCTLCSAAAESRMQQVSGGKRKITDFHLVRFITDVARTVVTIYPSQHRLVTTAPLKSQAPIFSNTAFLPELHAPMFAIRLLRDA